MKLDITNSEYYRLVLSYPFINTSTLVRINSRIKYPNVCELMEFNDYQIYKKQQDEINYYNKQIIACLKINDNEECRKFLDEKKNLYKTHIFFPSYYLMPYSLLWNKLQ
jgi:hypothetical protein